jgi:tRNA threonylcarbamoyladenosine biosynthesis protein TsaB
MTILGIETSSTVCSVGLADESGSLAEHSLVESHIHSEKLLTLIQEICESQKIKLPQLDAIGVSIGPGSFTGLRIGLSTAKGLCFALGKPLIAIPAFESIAEAVFTLHPQIDRVIVCVDAKQGDFYFSAYEKKNGTYCEFLPVQIGNLTTPLSVFTENTVFVTDRMDQVKKSSGTSGVIDNILSYCRGDVLARIAIDKMKTGITSAPENLEPMYLKDFVVRTQAKTR